MFRPINAQTVPSLARRAGFVSRACVIAGLVAANFVVLGSTSLYGEERAPQRKVAPLYPPAAKALRVEGVVKVTATIAPDGAVTKAEAKGGNRLLGDAAVDAIKKWKFASAGSETTQDVEVVFKLN
jgi:TonB family protein